MNINYEYTQLGYMAPPMAGETPEMEAAKSFNRAYNRGRIGQLLARLLRKDTHLQVLATQPLSSGRTNRIVTVPIRKIEGSLGRKEDFDASFHPLQEAIRIRWTSIYCAIRSDIPLPPVELVRTGDDFYVQDGHHRISVARSLDQESIEARIMN